MSLPDIKKGTMTMSSIAGMTVGGTGRMPDFSQMRERMFAKADANGDKGISLEEFQEAGKKMPIGGNASAEQAAEAFGRIDTDRNGSLVQSEMSAFGTRMSDQMRAMMTEMQSMGSFASGGGSQGDALLQAMGAYGGAEQQQQRSSDLTDMLLQSLDGDQGSRERTDIKA